MFDQPVDQPMVGAVLDEPAQSMGMDQPAEAGKQRTADAPEHDKADTRWWWDETSHVPLFTAACKQYDLDLLTLHGGSATELQDEVMVQTFLTYRMVQQSVSFLLATPPKMQFKPHRQAKGNQGKIGADPELAAFADTCEVALEQHLKEAGFAETLEDFTWNGLSFSASILKVTFQSDYASDAVTEQRLPDAQDNEARLRYLAEALAAGVFSESDAAYHEMQAETAALQGSEPEVWEGLVVENVPLKNFRVARNVTSFAHLYGADWMAHDLYWSCGDVLSKWQHLHRDDLSGATLYHVDSAANYQPMQKPNKQMSGAGPEDDKILLVREVWDRLSGRVIVLVEGVEVAVDEYIPTKGPNQFFPFVLWTATKEYETWYGRSIAHSLEKTQRRVDRKRTQEELARPRSRPRWAFDAGAMEQTEVDNLNDAEPDSITPVKHNAKDLADAFFPLVTNGGFDPAHFDTMSDYQEAEQAANIPRQALGSTGSAKFAVEVEAAAAGQNASASRLRRTFGTALERLGQVCMELLIWNARPEVIRLVASDQAVWPDDVQDRLRLLRGLSPTVTISYDSALDRQQKIEGIRGLVELAKASGQQLPLGPLARIFCKAVKLDDEGIDEVLAPDPREVTSQLAHLMQEEPDKFDPEVLAALASMGQEAGQRAQAAAMQHLSQQTPQQRSAPAQPAA